MPHILLIHPPYTVFGSQAHIQADEPLGLLSLAAWVRREGHTVEIFDAFRGLPYFQDEGGFYKAGLDQPTLERELSALQRPDVVGLTSMFTMHAKGVHDAAAAVKATWPDVPVVVGGSHASALPDWVLADENIDLVAVGEGELTLMEILDRAVAGKPLEDIAGTVVRRNGQIHHNEPRPFIKDIDTLPRIARDMLDMQVYMDEEYRNRVAMAPPRLNVITSRGCPCRCVFCSIHSIWRNSYRARDAMDVADELEDLVHTYGIREVAFQDDNLTLQRNRMATLCDEMIRRKLNLRWCTPNGVAIWSLDKELIDKMARAGCYKVTFGIETGCPESQKFIRKTQIKLDKCDEIIRYCNRRGMWTHSSFIVGFPYETQEQVEQTVRFAIDSDLDFAAFFVATPFPGTPLFDIYREAGLMPDMGDQLKVRFQGHQSSVMCPTKHFTVDQLNETIGSAYRRFYGSRVKKFLNPLRPLSKIKGWPELRYFWTLFKLYRSEFGNYA